jgi:hypothetical protein
VCRAALSALALRLPAGGSTFEPLEARMAHLLPLIERCEDADAPFDADGVMIFASSPPPRGVDDADEVCALCSDTLAAFAAHSNVQCIRAAADHALGAVCTAMRRAPLSARVAESGAALLAQLANMRCGAMDDDTGALCACTPQPLIQACEEVRAFALVQHTLRAFRGTTRCTQNSAARATFVAACRAAYVTLSRFGLAPSAARTHDALVRTLCAALSSSADDTSAPAASEEEAAEISIISISSFDDDEAEAAALDTLEVLAQYRGGAAHAPGTAAVAARVLTREVARACAAAAAGEPSSDATLFAALRFLVATLLRRGDATGTAAAARAAAGCGAAGALLNFVRLKTHCACRACAGCFAAALLPLLRALCDASPAIRADALAQGIMAATADVASAFYRFDAALSAAMELAAACMTPPPLPPARIAADADDAEARAWRAACAAAAAAAGGTDLLACAAHAACDSDGLLMRDDDDDENDAHPAAMTVRLSAGSHALCALAAFTAHGEAAVTRRWLEQRCPNGMPGGGMRSAAVAALRTMNLLEADAPRHDDDAAAADAAACHALAQPANAVSALVAALTAAPSFFDTRRAAKQAGAHAPHAAVGAAAAVRRRAGAAAVRVRRVRRGARRRVRHRGAVCAAARRARRARAHDAAARARGCRHAGSCHGAALAAGHAARGAAHARAAHGGGAVRCWQRQRRRGGGGGGGREGGGAGRRGSVS